MRFVKKKKEVLLMFRVQFYPNETLEKKLMDDSENLGISVSALITDILEAHYGLMSPESLSITKVMGKVFNEVEKYIQTLPEGEEFDLLKASETFKTIDMVCLGKPSTIRARIGKSFARQVRCGKFSNIEVVYKPNGEIKKSVNAATTYRKFVKSIMDC